MFLATAATLLVAASPAGPTLHLVPELALAADQEARPALVDPHQGSMSAGEVGLGIAVLAGASLLELLVSTPLLILAQAVAELGAPYAVPQLITTLLGVQLALAPMLIMVLQSGPAGKPLAGSQVNALLFGYAVELAAAICLTVGMLALNTYWGMLTLALASHIFLMPMATSLGLHLGPGGPPAQGAPPRVMAPPAPVHAPLLRISF